MPAGLCAHWRHYWSLRAERHTEYCVLRVSLRAARSTPRTTPRPPRVALYCAEEGLTRFAALAPDEHCKYVGVRATGTGDFSAEKQNVLDKMRKHLTALKEDRVLSRREREQIIVIAVCSVFRYFLSRGTSRQLSRYRTFIFSLFQLGST